MPLLQQPSGGCDVLLCCICACVDGSLWCNGWIKGLLDNDGVLVTCVSLCLMTLVLVLGELDRGQLNFEVIRNIYDLKVGRSLWRG